MTFLSQLYPSSQNEGTLRGEMNRQQANNAFPGQELVTKKNQVLGQVLGERPDEEPVPKNGLKYTQKSKLILVKPKYRRLFGNWPFIA